MGVFFRPPEPPPTSFLLHFFIAQIYHLKANWKPESITLFFITPEICLKWEKIFFSLSDAILCAKNNTLPKIARDTLIFTFFLQNHGIYLVVNFFVIYGKCYLEIFLLYCFFLFTAIWFHNFSNFFLFSTGFKAQAVVKVWTLNPFHNQAVAVLNLNLSFLPIYFNIKISFPLSSHIYLPSQKFPFWHFLMGCSTKKLLLVHQVLEIEKCFSTNIFPQIFL